MKHVLDPIVYWKLRALTADNHRLGVLAQQANAAAVQSQAKQDAAVAELAAQLHFDPKLPAFQLDDDTLAIVIPEPNTEKVS